MRTFAQALLIAMFMVGIFALMGLAQTALLAAGTLGGWVICGVILAGLIWGMVQVGRIVD